MMAGGGEARGVKRKLEADADKDLLEITPLGAGNEVGRSCHILRFKGKTIMVGCECASAPCARALTPRASQLDCGVHPAYSGMASLPFFDEIDPAEVDLLLVSHFHLDHASALPYFLNKTSFRGKCFMTPATKAIYNLILKDSIKVTSHSAAQSQSHSDALYTEEDLRSSMDKIDTLEYHQVVYHKGIKFWAYNAGHVLGAAMFMIEIAGVKVLYTGDYSRKDDRHLVGAETPEVKPDVLIIESTYGNQTLPPLADRERIFTRVLHDVVTRRRGRVLIPSFSLGRSQELLLLMEEYWTLNPSLHNVPIYYASALASKCLAVYQRYIHIMNQRLRDRAAVSNPFVFKYIHNRRRREDFEEDGPMVVMASPAMLQNGLSRELFDAWCTDERNACVIPGYSVAGTLAYEIKSEPKTVTTSAGQVVPLRMSVHYVAFSAHADYSDTSDFIRTLRPPYVVLVHGEENEMHRLRTALLEEHTDGSIQVLTPRNCQTVAMEFRSQKVAKVVGALARRPPEGGEVVSGLLIRKDFGYTLLSIEDLSQHTPLSSSTITQRLTVPFRHSLQTLVHFLRLMFELRLVDALPADLSVTRKPPPPPPQQQQQQQGVSAAAAAAPKSEAGESGEASASASASASSSSSSSSSSSAPADPAAPAAPAAEAKPAAPEPKAEADGSERLGPLIEVHSAVYLEARVAADDKARASGSDPWRRRADRVVLQWKSNPVSDMLADSVVALLLSVERDPGAALAIGMTSCSHAKAHAHAGHARERGGEKGKPAAEGTMKDEHDHEEKDAADAMQSSKSTASEEEEEEEGEDKGKDNDDEGDGVVEDEGEEHRLLAAKALEGAVLPLLRTYFSSVELLAAPARLRIRQDDGEAEVDVATRAVLRASSDELQARVEAVVERVMGVCMPIPAPMFGAPLAPAPVVAAAAVAEAKMSDGV
jgi:cleavage and polyadenylation specificity factor subunit 3